MLGSCITFGTIPARTVLPSTMFVGCSKTFIYSDNVYLWSKRVFDLDLASVTLTVCDSIFD